jgi:hypothetical protein
MVLMGGIKNALAGNRTRVDNLGGYHSTSKLLALLYPNLYIALSIILQKLYNSITINRMEIMLKSQL